MHAVPYKVYEKFAVIFNCVQNDANNMGTAIITVYTINTLLEGPL